MLINKIYRLLPGMAILTFITSCDKYLDQQPSKTSSLVVTTTAQLSALLNNYNTFYQEGNRTAIYSTDDADLPLDLYNARPSTFSMAQVEFTLWDINYLPDDGRESFWSGEYRKIFNANMALSYADKVTGTDEEKAVIKADAHFIRAYSYWELANTYCLPYTAANKQETGLPLKVGTGFEEPVVRQPLEKVYELIESDLAEALKTPVILSATGTPRHWRASKAGVNGFAARYYLNRNNYTEALKYANAALAEYSQLVDYNTEMKYGIDGKVTINAGTPTAQTVTIKYPYTHNNQSDMTDMIGWKEFLYFRMLYHESWWYIPSKALLDLYDHDHDLRYEYHIVEDYSYDRGLIKPAYSYPGYIFFYKDRIPSGPTVAEMLLIKAECLARNGSVSEALTAVNTLRAKRLKPGPWVNLVAAGKDAVIKVILEERRRELPFTQRWFDIRRFNNNEDPNDDVVLTRNFYSYTSSQVSSGEPAKTYTLPKNSRRFAAPLPRTEIISSNGLIEQNKY
ncbi:RagB/SusD family nutrient uptake outer membrane protein [Chitinophaga arvensicola]|uniref:SusD family protein n=1 Tax=Chitinophaga arvensicola TaxID=29529 RepID=A0A1I0R3T6_9BACT|nr:RagB/SusD family nutrient uptake outer membrane protein [Chitinophaga arvensicola]SEW35122.1 SusD family protein [Chitinophaga arvensicola]